MSQVICYEKVSLHLHLIPRLMETERTLFQPEGATAPHQREGVASENAYLLSTQGLRKIYDGRAVVNGIDINVRPGEIVSLLGPNGAGKTTTFYMIVGIVPPNGGKVFFNGRDATSEPMFKRARMGMGITRYTTLITKLIERVIIAVIGVRVPNMVRDMET